MTQKKTSYNMMWSSFVGDAHGNLVITDCKFCCDKYLMAQVEQVKKTWYKFIEPKIKW